MEAFLDKIEIDKGWRAHDEKKIVGYIFAH